MKYIIRFSLILVYICIFVLINNSHDSFLIDTEPPLVRTINAAKLYERNTDTLVNMFNSYSTNKDYLSELHKNIKKMSTSKIKNLEDITTNQRRSSMNYKDIYLTNLRIKSIYISGVVLLIIMLLILLTKEGFLSKPVLIIVMSLLLLAIILINIFYTFSFNRNNMYMNEYNFVKPSETSVELSKLDYYERRRKCNKGEPVHLLNKDKKHPYMDVEQYKTKSNKCQNK
jgi:hypothetical protein